MMSPRLGKISEKAYSLRVIPGGQSSLRERIFGNFKEWTQEQSKYSPGFLNMLLKV